MRHPEGLRSEFSRQLVRNALTKAKKQIKLVAVAVGVTALSTKYGPMTKHEVNTEK